MNQALKIIGFSVLAMVVLFAMGTYFLVGKFKQDVAGIGAMQEVRNTELARIHALPELRGVLVSNEPVEAPFSHVPVAACLLGQGRMLRLSGPSGGRSSGPSRGRSYAFEDDAVVLAQAGAVLLIDGTAFPFTLDSLILSRPVGQRGGPRTNGVAGATFESGRITDLLDPGHDEAERRIRALHRRSALLDAYIRKGTRLGDPEVRLDEVLFLAGDTLSFHGRIEGDMLVPLF